MKLRNFFLLSFRFILCFFCCCIHILICLPVLASELIKKNSHKVMMILLWFVKKKKKKKREWKKEISFGKVSFFFFFLHSLNFWKRKRKTKKISIFKHWKLITIQTNFFDIIAIHLILFSLSSTLSDYIFFFFGIISFFARFLLNEHFHH